MINFIPNPAAAFRKDKFLEIGGYDPAFTVSEDYDLWLRFLNAKAKFCYTRKVLVNYRSSRKSISRKKREIMHYYVQKTRFKNQIPPVDLKRIRGLATPGIAQLILAKKTSTIFLDERFEEDKNAK